jgi:hypothetical protein
MTAKSMLFTESVRQTYETKRPGNLTEALGDSIPPVIFPEMWAITANSVTKNYTNYSKKNLIGNPEELTGLTSWYSPYNVPVIANHDDGSGWGEACAPYGRIYHSSFQNTKAGGGWVRLVGAITDPWAIEMVLTQRYLTMSIGASTNDVRCSICIAQLGKKAPNMVEEGRCDHYRGKTYAEGLCYWEIGPVKAREISFVNVPADVNARVINPSIESEAARKLLAGTGASSLVDLATGTSESADRVARDVLGVSNRTYDRIIRQALETQKIYEHVCGHAPKLGHLPEDKDKIREFYRLQKGL